MSHYKTEQEQFWAGQFGDDYISRNKSERLFAANFAFFAKILSATQELNSVIEFGANIGLNLRVIQSLRPGVELSAVEINQKAVEEMEKHRIGKIYAQSILEYVPDFPRDLAFTKGVLIHINPEHLPKVYDILYQSSQKYICVAEYYNPSPVELNYRGHSQKLFKRDFAGEILDRFKDLKLVDYGFSYHRDNCFPQDDITWFLLKKC